MTTDARQANGWVSPDEQPPLPSVDVRLRLAWGLDGQRDAECVGHLDGWGQWWTNREQKIAAPVTGWKRLENGDDD